MFDLFRQEAIAGGWIRVARTINGEGPKMRKPIQASPPTFTVIVRPDGEILKTRLPFGQANVVAVVFNRLVADKNRRAELLREENAVRWVSEVPVRLRPRSVRRNFLICP